MKATSTFIYALADPITNRTHYIGKSDDPNRRLKQHIGQAKKYSGWGKRGSSKDAWIAHLLSKDLEPRLVILEEVPLNRWQGAERSWIKKARSNGCRLYNEAPGGAWVPPRKRSRKKFRKSP